MFRRPLTSLVSLARRYRKVQTDPAVVAAMDALFEHIVARVNANDVAAVATEISSVRLFWTQIDKPANRAITCSTGDAARVAAALGLAQVSKLGSVLRVVVSAALGHKAWASHVTQVLPNIESSFPEHALEKVSFESYKAVGGDSYATGRLKNEFFHKESKRGFFTGVNSVVKKFDDGAFESLVKLDAALKFDPDKVFDKVFARHTTSSWQAKVESMGGASRHPDGLDNLFKDAMNHDPCHQEPWDGEDYREMMHQVFNWRGKHDRDYM
jgi:hypothetical protein